MKRQIWTWSGPHFSKSEHPFLKNVALLHNAWVRGAAERLGRTARGPRRLGDRCGGGTHLQIER